MEQLKFSAALVLLFVTGLVRGQELGVQVGINNNSFALNNDLFEVIPLIVDVSEASDIFDLTDTEGVVSIGELVDLNTRADFGYNVGLTYDYAINDRLGLQVAGLISKKGYRANVDLLGSIVRGFVDIDLMNIDIPIQLKYNMDMANDKKFFLSAGPYVSYGFSAKETMGVKVLGLGGGIESDLIWGGTTDLINRTDYGLVGGLGVDLGKVDLGLQYRFGLANLNPIDIDGAELRQQTLSVNVGYKF